MIVDPHLVATQIARLHKTRDTGQGISEQTPVIKFDKSELK